MLTHFVCCATVSLVIAVILYKKRLRSHLCCSQTNTFCDYTKLKHLSSFSEDPSPHCYSVSHCLSCSPDDIEMHACVFLALHLPVVYLFLSCAFHRFSSVSPSC